MCDASSMLAVSGGATALGQLAQGSAAKASGNAQGQQDDYLAKVSLDDAQQQAQMIRRAGARAVGRADADTAASGIVVGQGSSGDIERDIDTQSEHDAYTALLSGSRRARGYQVSGVAARAGGAAAQANSIAAAGSTVLSTGYKMATTSGWGGGSFNLAGLAGSARARLDGSYNEDYGNEGRSNYPGG